MCNYEDKMQIVELNKYKCKISKLGPLPCTFVCYQVTVVLGSYFYTNFIQLEARRMTDRVVSAIYTKDSNYYQSHFQTFGSPINSLVWSSRSSSFFLLTSGILPASALPRFSLRTVVLVLERN